ncbi:MAG TPA: chemotaxis protein CheW [Rhodanobacteraceae bacterium]|nr:chemotaxis protein CheW [Rhodanobacteraceae bacterium]
MNELPREIRGVMIPVSGTRVLLPNATVAEVITFATPELVAGAPAWLLGRIRWRGWRVPLVSFSTLAGYGSGEGALHARVAVLKALGGHPKLPFLAMLTQGFPRLTTLTPDLLMPTGDGHALPPCVREEVLLRDDLAVIPDMPALEDLLAEVLAAAA